MAITTFSIRFSQLTVSPTSSLQTAVLFSLKRKTPSIDEDTYTQFAACKQLGVELGFASGKGRVERLNQTLSRLPVELRLAGITTIDAANEFLNFQ